MEERTFWETVKVESSELLERVKRILHEGNVRRIIVKQGDRSIAEFPLTVGVVGTVFAPILAAIGVLVALLKDCSIEVERAAPEPAAEPAAEPAETPPAAEAPAAAGEQPKETDQASQDGHPD